MNKVFTCSPNFEKLFKKALIKSKVEEIDIEWIEINGSKFVRKTPAVLRFHMSDDCDLGDAKAYLAKRGFVISEESSDETDESEDSDEETYSELVGLIKEAKRIALLQKLKDL